jgi:uncharacterized linocin/CFP29 family protein
MKNKATRFNPRRGAQLAAPGPYRGLASAVQAAGSLHVIRALAPLPKDAQELIDDAVIRVGLDRLVIVQDFIAEGLTFPLPDWLAVPELYWEKTNAPGHARRVMVPKARGERQLQDREGTRIPIYATIEDFSIGIREQLASARAGAPLDTSGIVEATRRVNEAIEDAIINGGPTVGGFASPGLLNAPSLNTQAYSGSNPAWDHASKTGQEIINDVLAMAGKLRAARKFGPYNLYIPTDYGNALNRNFSDGVATFDYTIRERIERMIYGSRAIRVREADQLPDDRTVLIQMTSDVADVIVGDEPMPISWESPDGFEFNHVIMACIVPRLKDTYTNQSGICVGNTS